MEPVTLYDPQEHRPVVVTTPVEEVRLRAYGYGDVPPEAVPVPDAEDGEQAPFNPSEHTVPDVQAFLAEHPELADVVLAAERAGKNRTTLTGPADAATDADSDNGADDGAEAGSDT